MPESRACDGNTWREERAPAVEQMTTDYDVTVVPSLKRLSGACCPAPPACRHWRW